MAVQDISERPSRGSIGAAISQAIVGLVREYSGRGPTKARTTIADDHVLVVLQDSLSKGEQTLVGNGRERMVLDIRSEFQDAMREDAMAVVAELTGRRVIAMLGADHVDPDLAAKIFILEPQLEGDAERSDPAIAAHSPSAADGSLASIDPNGWHRRAAA